MAPCKAVEESTRHFPSNKPHAAIPSDTLDQYLDETIEAQRELTIAGVLRLVEPGRVGNDDQRGTVSPW